MDDLPELVMDPDPVTIDTFFPCAARSEAPRYALAFRGERVEKLPCAADEAAIRAAEQRLGVRLPETLRRIYAVRDGGHVGHLLAPRVAAPRPVLADWCGAFAPDYSSLRPLRTLETVANSYANVDVDPADVPANATRLVILEARYGDMTLLDYTASDRDPAVLLVDFDREGDPVSLRFADFDTFLAALRRDRGEDDGIGIPGPPLGAMPQAAWPGLFWNDAAPRIYRNIAEWHMGDRMPAPVADDATIAAAEHRLGICLPAPLRPLLAARNGGGAAAGWLGTGPAARRVIDQIAPIEFWANFAELSGRVAFPPGERPWSDGIDAADRLIVIDAVDDVALLLDHRDGAAPDLVIADGLAAARGVRLERLGPVASIVPRLRPPAGGARAW